ncbi:MAG: hypothetical protein Q7T96_04260 [Methylobacter sp.]|nr:hypothetical protein [Methylobacter sp.]
MEGDPKFEASQDLPDFPYARFAGLSVGGAGSLTDTNVPPHITFNQASAYTSAILQGDQEFGCYYQGVL